MNSTKILTIIHTFNYSNVLKLVFAVTASGPRENSFGCYCKKESGPYNTCLGDLFSVTWMEDLDVVRHTQYFKTLMLVLSTHIQTIHLTFLIQYMFISYRL